MGDRGCGARTVFLYSFFLGGGVDGDRMECMSRDEVIMTGMK